MVVCVKEDMTGWIMSEHGIEDSRLTVMYQVDDYVTPSGKRAAQWLCKCNCDKDSHIIAIGSKIKNGIVKSCGCMSKEARFSNKYNQYDYSYEYGVGFCNNTGSEFYFDWEDFDKIKDYSWYEYISNNGLYHTVRAYDPNAHKKVTMAQLIKGYDYDHENRNPLDNRKENLRVASSQENSRNRTIQRNNTSGFVGVSWHKRSNKWTAQIKVDGQLIHLGIFTEKYDAIIARLKAEMKYFGIEFAPQRHLFAEYDIVCDRKKKNEIEVRNDK